MPFIKFLVGSEQKKKEEKGAPHFGVCGLKDYIDKSNSEADG